MKLYFVCPKCDETSSFRSWVKDRVELAKEKGDRLEMNCKKCGSYCRIPVDEVHVKRSYIAEIIAILILLIGTPALLYGFNRALFDTVYVVVYSGVFLTPVIMYRIILKQDMDRVNAFNRFKTKG